MRTKTLIEQIADLMTQIEGRAERVHIKGDEYLLIGKRDLTARLDAIYELAEQMDEPLPTMHETSGADVVAQMMRDLSGRA